MRDLIVLSKIQPQRPYFEPSDDPTEQTPPEPTVPTCINVEAVRCFYPRKDNRPGTRLTFIDGGGFAVSESFDEVRAMFEGAARG